VLKFYTFMLTSPILKYHIVYLSCNLRFYRLWNWWTMTRS
jgi:hypothetical protein